MQPVLQECIFFNRETLKIIHHFGFKEHFEQCQGILQFSLVSNDSEMIHVIQALAYSEKFPYHTVRS